MKIIESLSDNNRYWLAVEAEYGPLRSCLIMVEATLVIGFGWIVNRILTLSAGTGGDRAKELFQGIEGAIEMLLASSVEPGHSVWA